MGIEYAKLTHFYSGASSTIRDVPAPLWWGLAIGLALLVFWTTRK